MGSLLPLLATFGLLGLASVLLATVGRRRRARVRALPQAKRAALEDRVGEELAALVDGAAMLRAQLEDTRAAGREMLAVEAHLGGSMRRPLWRQIEDANFGHDLDRLADEVLAWLARYDALGAAERELLDGLELDVAPVRALVRAPEVEAASASAAPRDRGEQLAAVQDRLEAAIACLRRFEGRVAAYRARSYR